MKDLERTMELSEELTVNEMQIIVIEELISGYTFLRMNGQPHLSIEEYARATIGHMLRSK